MVEAYKKILAAQYEAVMFMLHECLEKCPAQCWDSPIGKYPFWQVAYHTLCITDGYLSPNEDAFETQPKFHPNGKAEIEDEYPSRRFEQAELLDYLNFCRQKAIKSVADETTESLAGPSGFPWYKVTRYEMHFVNLRHVQHHVGQLSACMRRTDASLQDPKAVRWSGSGWKT
jgi:hypothetical protein